jgi:glucose-1-phosphate adenylyltransferase
VPDKTVGVILGGGVGTRLSPLTRERSKPAVPFGGKYRLVDVPISNCLNGGIRRIFVLTQFNSASLNNHVNHTYRFDAFGRSFVDILAAEQTPERATWYQGTADAVRQNLRHIVNRPGVDRALVLAGDQLYRMDFRAVVVEHEASGADVTVAVTPIRREDAPRYGILTIDGSNDVTRFVEKPALDALEGLESERGILGSMGIYLFNRDVLEQELLQSDANDFGHGILPGLVGRRHLRAHVFEGYFEDLGTIRTFYDANLDLTDPLPRFNFYEPLAPIYTRPRFLPGSKVDDCHIVRSLVTEGVILDHCHVERSVIGIRSRIQHGATLKDALVMGADFYQLPEAIQADIDAGVPPIGIGEGAVVEGAIVDKNARIGKGARIVNVENKTLADGENFVIRDGIVVIPKNVVVHDGSVI